jgi:hypothetical protein
VSRRDGLVHAALGVWLLAIGPWAFWYAAVWLTIWPVCWVGEWWRSKLGRAKSVVLGYYVSVGVRVIVGLGLALAIDLWWHGEAGSNAGYWFAWLINYLISLIAETVLGVRRLRDLSPGADA